jgi:hypothetical protein
MTTVSRTNRARVGLAARRITASFVAAPPCAVCGRGHAQSGWHIDPMGGVHGRCPGCIDDASASAAIPKSHAPPAT